MWQVPRYNQRSSFKGGFSAIIFVFSRLDLRLYVTSTPGVTPGGTQGPRVVLRWDAEDVEDAKGR